VFNKNHIVNETVKKCLESYLKNYFVSVINYMLMQINSAVEYFKIKISVANFISYKTISSHNFL
jgi:hypothetical protein